MDVFLANKPLGQLCHQVLQLVKIKSLGCRVVGDHPIFKILYLVVFSISKLRVACL